MPTPSSRGSIRLWPAEQMEYEALMSEPGLPERIWHPSRSADGPPIAWSDL